MHDPFDECVAELRETLALAHVAANTIQSKGIVDRGRLAGLLSSVTEAEEDVQLLKNGLQIAENRGGVVNGKRFTAKELLARQELVRALEVDVVELRRIADRVQQSADSGKRVDIGVDRAPYDEGADVGAVWDSSRGRKDGFMVAHELIQREEEDLQDSALDRMGQQLHELRQTGVTINDELVEQDAMLEDLDRNVGGLQDRLRVLNARLDKLLASMSDRGKYCMIISLMATLSFLVFFVFN